MIIYLDELKKMSGYEQPALIIKWLKANGINFFVGKDNCISTTLDAVNARLIPQGKAKKKIEF